MGILTKDQILAAKDLKTKVETVEEWGGDVILSTMTGTERDDFEFEIFRDKGLNEEVNLKNIRAKLLSKCIKDEEGNRVFPAAKDIKALGNKSALVLDRLFSMAQKMNGMTKEDIDDMAKNFKPDQSESSTID